MEFFPPDPAHDPEPEPAEQAQPPWMGAPDDMLPGVVAVELVLGRSESTAVLLTGMLAYPSGVVMTLGVRTRGPVLRRDLTAEVFDGPFQHDMDATWRAGRLKWGFELADGRRVTNVDGHAFPGPDEDFATWLPDRPVLQGGGGSSGGRTADRRYWLWPLPPPGPLRLVCQWIDQGIELTVHQLEAQPILDAAGRARDVWSG